MVYEFLELWIRPSWHRDHLFGSHGIHPAHPHSKVFGLNTVVVNDSILCNLCTWVPSEIVLCFGLGCWSNIERLANCFWDWILIETSNMFGSWWSCSKRFLINAKYAWNCWWLLQFLLLYQSSRDLIWSLWFPIFPFLRLRYWSMFHGPLSSYLLFQVQ